MSSAYSHTHTHADTHTQIGAQAISHRVSIARAIHVTKRSQICANRSSSAADLSFHPLRIDSVHYSLSTVVPFSTVAIHLDRFAVWLIIAAKCSPLKQERQMSKIKPERKKEKKNERTNGRQIDGEETNNLKESSEKKEH